MPEKGRAWEMKKVTRYPMFYVGNGIAEEIRPMKNGPRGGSNFVGETTPTETEWKEIVFCCKAPLR